MLQSLQILRLIAATSVVYYHITFTFGSFGVDIFFVLSGFVIALVVSNKQNPFFFAISRISRIVPIYWLLTTLLLILIFVAPNLVHESSAANADIFNYLRSLFFIPFFEGVEMKPILQLGWTLNYEMIFYALTWISLLLSRKSLMLASTILILLFFAFSFLIKNNMASSFFGNDIILEFVLGIIAFKIYSTSFLKRVSPILLFLILIFSYCLMIYFQIEDLTTSRLLFYGLPSFLIILSFVGLENKILNAKTNIISFLVSMGDASYSTYLTHWYVIVACRKVFSEKLKIYDFYSTFGILLTLIFSLIVGQLIYKYADSPMNHRVKKYLLNNLSKFKS